MATQPNSNKCPTCGGPLFFSGNGRSRQCDRCGYREAVATKQPSLKELEYVQRLRNGYDHLNSEDGRSSARIRLAEGRELVRNGRCDDAYEALTHVLKTQSTEAERAEAWYWLSHVFSEAAERRACLEHALALNPGDGAARRDLAILDGRLAAADVIDPETVGAGREAAVETARAQQHACPRCGAAVGFDAEQQAYHCAFCGLSETVAEHDARESEGVFGKGKYEQDFMAALATAKGHLAPINLRVLQCQSCATDFMLAPKTLSVTCPYCQSVFVTETAESRDIVPPHALLPFSVNQEQAMARLRGWLKQLRLRPTQIAPLLGVYQPVWTFDVGGEIKWRGVVEENERCVPVSGSKLIFFDDVLVPGCRHVSKQLLQNFRAFDLGAIEPYDARYLAQWPAERYTLPLADASLRGRTRVLQTLRKNPKKLTHHAGRVRQLQISTQKVVVESFKLLLLPVWIGHYVVNDTEFEVTINGQNGRVVAERPSSLINTIRSWLG